jgi:hypothetical protein
MSGTFVVLTPLVANPPTPLGQTALAVSQPAPPTPRVEFIGALDNNTGDQGPVVNVVPAGDAPAAPQAPPAPPGAVPLPNEEPALFEESDNLWTRACDSCFRDGQWESSTTEEVALAPSRPPDTDLTPFGHVAGLVLTLGLGGSWRSVSDEAEARRRPTAKC